MTPAKMIESYLRLRREIHDVEAEHKAALAPLLELRAQLEGALLNALNESQVDSMKSEAGIAFKSTATSVTVRDWVATLDYIREHQLWDLLEARVSKTATLDFMTEKEQPVPGVEVSQVSVLRVRQN